LKLLKGYHEIEKNPFRGGELITVLLVEDHIFILQALRFFLEAAEGIQIIATASNGIEAIAQARLSCPDVAVLDVSMPLMGGIEATQQIRSHCPNTRVMMFSLLDHPDHVHQALQAGAVGYVLKDMFQKDLIAAVRAVFSGNRYFTEQIAWIAERYFLAADSDLPGQSSLLASPSDDSLPSLPEQ